MPFKTIVTYLPSHERAGPLLDLVLPLARKNEARHVGLHIIPQIFTAYGVAEIQVPPDVIEMQHKGLRDRADMIESVFAEKAAHCGVTSEWRSHDAHHGDIAEEIADQALCADLIVMGLDTEESPDGWTDVPARIAMQTGRPVLAIPNPEQVKTLGERVIVAWNASRQSARAAFDALPLMTNASIVQVLAVDPKNQAGHELITHGKEMALCLAGHGVKAEASVTYRQGVPIADVILNRMAEENCDLLVMGCYGQSRLRETLFGGATRELLHHLRVPILMSH